VLDQHQHGRGCCRRQLLPFLLGLSQHVQEALHAPAKQLLLPELLGCCKTGLLLAPGCTRCAPG
jgi:hypothetical protein